MGGNENQDAALELSTLVTNIGIGVCITVLLVLVWIMFMVATTKIDGDL